MEDQTPYGIRKPDPGAEILRVKVLGTSMLPTLKAGDTLLVKKAKVEDLREGDLAYFWICNSPTVHRVVSVHMEESRREIVTKGDNLPFLDQPTPEGRIIGRVVGKFEDGGLVYDLSLSTDESSGRKDH